MISWFENGTTDIQYGYVEALGDGRGYTVGRGLTTATGDAFRVVVAYCQGRAAAICRYEPRLSTLAEDGDPSTDGLDGFPDAWRAAAADAAFRRAQDAEVDTASYQPALRHADELGVRSALGQASLYDAVFTHGDGPDPDGVPALIAQATQQAGGTPASGVAEERWLRAFLTVRRADMASAHDPATREVWAQAVTRVDAWIHLLDAGNLSLAGPITVGGPDDAVVIP